MWAQSWAAIEDLVRPYPEEDGVDATPEMVNQVINEIYQLNYNCRGQSVLFYMELFLISGIGCSRYVCDG